MIRVIKDLSNGLRQLTILNDAREADDDQDESDTEMVVCDIKPEVIDGEGTITLINKDLGYGVIDDYVRFNLAMFEYLEKGDIVNYVANKHHKRIYPVVERMWLSDRQPAKTPNRSSSSLNSTPSSSSPSLNTSGFEEESNSDEENIPSRLHCPPQKRISYDTPRGRPEFLRNKRKKKRDFYETESSIRSHLKSGSVIKGSPPFKLNKHIRRVNLPFYHVPDELWSAVENDARISEIYPLLDEELTPSNYQKRFSLLLHLEDIWCCLAMRQFDVKDVTLIRRGSVFELNVPGLADGRPSLIAGDSLLCMAKKSGTVYRGFIKEVMKCNICIKFSLRFEETSADDKCDIYFLYNRTTIRRCHRALESFPIYEKVLFPEVNSKKPLLANIQFPKLQLYNESLNKEQRLAVTVISRAEFRPSPYIIFGPPGTGKTVTLVETILQVLKYFNSCRILACAVSNNATDLIATKLLNSGIVKPNKLVRLHAHSHMANCPEQLKKISMVLDGEESNFRQWLRSQVTVTTCCNALTLAGKLLPEHRFTHIFIDEAGQCTEPQTLIPITLGTTKKDINGEIKPNSVLILAGDHMQLGPVVLSPIARTYDFGQSLMKRLMGHDSYSRKEKYANFGMYNPHYVTKLLNNYRSNSFIMDICSKKFYESELSYANEVDDGLLKKLQLSAPVVMHHVDGFDKQEEDSPSWYNLEEANEVMDYLTKLHAAGITSDEIVVITPYRKQVEKLRSKISAKQDFAGCRVATIDEFQGEEAKVIILSTVRADTEYLRHDRRFNLGFIFNDKRINVAISRAKSLLIVIGDTSVLASDPTWKDFMDYCQSLGTLKSCW